MKHHKAYNFRIYPNKKQAVLIHKTIGCSRFVFNHFLGEQKQKDAMWRTVEDMVQNGQLPSNNWKGTFFHKYEVIKEIPHLKKQHSFLKEVDSIALQKAVENLHDAYTRYYKKQNKTPRFKSKRNPVQSYTTKYTNGNIAIVDNQVKLPKLGWVRFAKSREVEGRILNATVRRNPSGKYFISIVAEVEIAHLPKNHQEVGIDLGITNFAICSDGTTYANLRSLQKMENKLRQAQRTLSRRVQGSSNWQKQRIRVARIHETIANRRKDYLHKISTAIIKNHDVVCIEGLRVVNMLKNHQLAQAISDVSWAEFTAMLTYKAHWYGKHLVKVATMFPSSQLCSDCGSRNQAVKDLSLREWICPTCQTQHDRDLNASRNILAEGKRLLTQPA